MEAFYGLEESSNSRGQSHGPLSDTSSALSERRQNRHPHPTQQLRSQSLEDEEEEQQDVLQDRHRHRQRYSDYAPPRRHHHHHGETRSVTSTDATMSTSLSAHGGNQTVEISDNDSHFLSVVSGLPSADLEDISPSAAEHQLAPPPPPPPQSERARSTAATDFQSPVWPSGANAMERRIHYAVDDDDVRPDDSGAKRVDHYRQRSDSTNPDRGRSQSTTPSCASFPSTLPMPPQNFASSASSNSMTQAPSVAARPAAAAAAAPSSLPRPRMQEAELVTDPRSRLLDLVITNTTASVALSEIEKEMQWSTRYEPMYGALLEYLQSYQSIFVVSPVDDQVRLRRTFSIRTAEATAAARQTSTARQRPGRRGTKVTAMSAHQRSSSAADRRSGRPTLPSAEALAAHIGSISYSCVAEHLNLDLLECVYRRRGYDTSTLYGVLHVTNENYLDLFLFSSGAVVWWGMDRKDHWMVEDDFLSEANHLTDGVEHRYGQAEIAALFPIWCSYEVDEQCAYMQVSSPIKVRSSVVEPSLERLSKVLRFDHYLVPASEPARSLVMLTFSHSLSRSARVDYFEFLTKWSHRHIFSIPTELTGLLDYFSTKRRITKLEGEIEVAQLVIQSIHDTPDVLWEVPWLQAYYDMAEQQNTTQSRLSWFASRSDTLLEQLSHIKARRHRLFMLGSDVFLIVLLILDVMFMTSRLVAKLYFKVEEDE